MKYFAVFLPMIDEEKSKKFREEHLLYLKSMKENGNTFAYGKFVDGAGGLVIYKASSYDEVKGFVEQDPFVINHARGYEIHEWEIVSDAINS